MSGWGDLMGDYEEVVDESTGEKIMMKKGAKQYKLDAQGNIINPPPAAEAPAPASSSSSVFAAAAAGSSSAAGGGFKFGTGGGGGFVPPGGGFVPSAAPTGFAFGGGAAAAAAPTFGEKRRADEATPAAAPAAAPKRRRTRALALTGSETGAVFVVGNGDCGQLGLGDDGERDSQRPLRLTALDGQRIRQVACGGMHSVALTFDGKLFSWGCNDDDSLGRGGEESECHPVGGALAGAEVAMVTAGDSHTAALTRDGKVYSWGTYRDSNGYLGYSADEKKAAEPRLVALQGGALIKQIASGADHTLAVGANGVDVYSWGCGEKGQIGCGISWEAGEKGDIKKKQLTPNAPFGLAVPEWRGAGGAKARVGRALNENFWRAIGQKVAAEAGADLRGACAEYLRHRADLDAQGAALDDKLRVRVRAAFAGAYHSFLLTEAGDVYAFGLNNHGQLGLGSLEPPFSAEPLLVDALQGERVVQIVAGEHHSLALAADGAVFAFGRGDNSQLGLPGVEQQVTPAKVPALDGVRVAKLASGSNQCMALSDAGELYSWGFGEMGQLCNGKSADEKEPALVDAAEVARRDVLDVASGAQHTVVLAMERAE